MSLKSSKKSNGKSNEINDIFFNLPCVEDPIIGSPKEVKKKLDKMAIYIRNHPKEEEKCQELFDKIHLYMHGYLINVVFKQFPYIRGYQKSDIYQEALIALKFNAIDSFRSGKGKSFLGFAKLCIRRHLITLLHTSNTRLKDQPINNSSSLDRDMDENGDSGNTFVNFLPDKEDSVDVKTEEKEAYEFTLDKLNNVLSKMEKMVLLEYLSSSSYNEIAVRLNEKSSKRYCSKSIDNALVRIRIKAQKLKEEISSEELPIFIKKQD